MALHLTEILGEQLLSTTLDGLLPTQLPSPEVGALFPEPGLYRGFHTLPISAPSSMPLLSLLLTLRWIILLFNILETTFF